MPSCGARQTLDKKIAELTRDPIVAKKVQAALEDEQAACIAADEEIRQADIEHYGLDLVEEFERWEKLTDDVGPYVVIFRSGKSLKVEVIKFECAEIEDKARGKNRVVLDCLFPSEFERTAKNGWSGKKKSD